MAERLDFSRRAELVEDMDRPCSDEEMRACLHDIAAVNWLTLAHRPVILWLNELVRARGPRLPRPLKIVDVGCGYGDLLRRIERWAARRGVAVELAGIDLNQQAVRAAHEATPAASRIEWVCGDAYSCAQASEADVVLCSLLTHHLVEPEIVRFLEWMETTARVGWFICDLHRKPVPYRLFGVLMRGAWWHRFIRLDGMRSIRRSFLEEDWVRMCAAAGLEADQVEIRGYWPARLCVGRVKSPAG
jgi:2-polyprenyl-3-methyl-5-hydroxy-6-metoxy-1,4-benzoquinol methylase